MKIKKLLCFLFVAVIALSTTGCATNGGSLTINATKISTEISSKAETFKSGGFEFEYFGVKNDGNGNFVFDTDNSYIQSINGIPDHLMRFKTPSKTGDILVYGLNDSGSRVLLEKQHLSENTESSYVLAGYSNFRIEYRIRPGETKFESVNIGTLFFWC